MKVTFSRPSTTRVSAAPAPVVSSPPIAIARPRRAVPSYLLPVAGVVVVALVAAVAWMWSLLTGGTCQGVVACATITLRATQRGRVAAVPVALGERVHIGDRLVLLEAPDQAEELARLRQRRAAEARLLALLDAAVVPDAVRPPPAPTTGGPPVPDAAATAARAAEITALTNEVAAATEEAAAREEVRERMALLVRLDAALPEDVASAGREARLARARADTLAARLAGLTAVVPPAAPVTATPAPAVAPPDQRPAIRERLAAIDAAILQAGPHAITATIDGTVQELPAPGSEVVVDGKVAVVADTGHLWIDAYLPMERGDRIARLRSARIRGLAQELPLRAAVWHEQAVPANLRPWLSAATALGLRLDLPAAAPFIAGQVVELTLR